MKIKLFAALFVLVVISATDNSIAQPIQKTNYDWINYSRIFILDGHAYPLFPKIELDAEKLAETMLDMHANVVRIVTSYTTGCFIPGTEFKPSMNLGDRDLLAECITACKPRGIKVIPYVGTGNSIITSLIDPEWAQKISPAGDIPSFWDAGGMATPTCWNTPYRQAFYDFINHIMENYDIDGIYFDAWAPFYNFIGKENICYCEGCSKGFREASGKEIPYRENNENYSLPELEIIRQYHKWYKEEMYEAFSETKRIIKSHKDIPLIFNINNPERIMNGDLRIINGSDAFMYERGRSMIERAEGVSLATAHGLTVWPYIGTYDPFPRIPHFKYELSQEIYTTVAFGGSPILYHTYFFADHPESRGPIKEAFQLFDKNEKYIKGFNSYEFCAVVWNNYDPPGHEESGYLWNVNARLNSLGAFSECINNNIQTTSMLKLDLDNPDIINKYKVLYLPDICYLTDKQVENISKFVENGGGLIMSYATSLYDENGNERTDFALGNLAQIRFHKPDEKMSKKISVNRTFGSLSDVYLKTKPGQEIIKPPLAGIFLPTHLFENVDVLPGGKVVADMVIGTDNEPLAPGLVISSYGKGKVAYISAASSSMYMQTSIREYSDLISNIIEYVSNDNIPYEVEAPFSSLITNMTTNGDTSVLHLINHTGTKSERMWQNEYYIPPIEKVTIKYRIPDNKKVKKIALFIPQKFTQKKEKDFLYITLPRIDKYQAVIVEME
jgi:hypothetical protein